MMERYIPGAAGAYGVIPFAVIIVASFICSALFMRYYWKAREKDRTSAFTATLGLWLALLTSFLLPLDVFLISFMKNPDGTFKDWATNATRMSVEDGMNYTYYSLYGVVLIFAFFLLPLVYFVYEEKDDLDDRLSKRCLSGLPFAAIFLAGAVILLLLGAFIPYRQIPIDNKNDTEWDIMRKILDKIYTNKGIDALYFIINVLMLIGMFCLVFYTGIGLSSFPVSMIRGWRSMSMEKALLAEKKSTLETRKTILESKPRLSKRQQRELSSIGEEIHLLARAENQIKLFSKGICYRCLPLLKVFNIVIGIVGIAMGFIIWLGLLLVNIDKLINSLGFKSGYLLIVQKIVNPLDYVMVQCQKVFPIDYIFYFCIVLFLIFCSINGIRQFGVRCFCIKMFSIRPHKTEPQALIILCVILMYTIFGLNVLMYSALPQYTTFGSQHYVNSTTSAVLPCSHEASEDDCLMTRASKFLTLFAIKAWMFEATYFWLTWVFLIMVVLGFIWAILKSTYSFIEEAVDRDDFEDSDDDVQPIVP